MIRLFILILLQGMLVVGAECFLKVALTKIGTFSWTWAFFKAQLTNWWYLGCGISFGVATVLWFYLLKHFPLSIVYPLTSLSYIFGMAAAILIFHEQVNWVQWIGVFLIMAGSALMVR